MGYANLDAYLAKLPNGLQSFQEVRIKGAVTNEFAGGFPLGEDLSQFPPELAEFVKRPHGASSWVPVVLHYAAMLARMAQAGASEKQYLEFTKRQTAQIFAQPTYKLLILVASPSILIRGSAHRFGMFHTGMTLTSLSRGDREWELHMSYPAEAVPPLVRVGYGTTFETILECSGAKGGKVEMTAQSATQTTYRATWQR